MHSAPRKLSECLAGAIVALLLASYGWLTLVNEGVTLGIPLNGQTTPRQAYVEGSTAVVYAAGVFVASGLFSFLAARALRLRTRSCLIVALAVTLHPAIYLLVERVVGAEHSSQRPSAMSLGSSMDAAGGEDGRCVARAVTPT
jgi:hypothetical protein